MSGRSPQSPEARRKRLAALHARFGREAIAKLRDSDRPAEVAKRVAIGVYNDGFIHAGNLAYISLLALFPFIILATAVATLIGRGGDSEAAIFTILSQLPPNVAEVLAEPLLEVSSGRTGPLLWFGALIGMWTAASFIETIREILRRAYGMQYSAPFWEYRLASIGLIVGSVFLLMIAFASAVTLSSLQHLVNVYLPISQNIGAALGLARIIPALTLFGTIYAIIFALTPLRYRKRGCRKWPGVLLITIWWLLTVELLPNAIGAFGGYGRTYGSLAGVMITLIFFYIIGFGVVIGAELNAALADAGDSALKGEKYEGPYSDELEVEDPGEDEEDQE
ncbi:YihY/virulence factor BrkB family protein [Sphingomicrobium lutaoense]|uniref:Membrane protein n=1 Tax=Sphingomicrobium lutaoense TaxID=515949 RepID=A0A839YV73_9SPHN|nr:YihY/virulence factor BrkB family protein [Sphingomicrobium lutaoense]MBB3763109.1 membrane protein [Sphingomicrobium lutaoense]